MNWAELDEMVAQRRGGAEVSVELYTRSAVRSGQVTCPAGSRLSDVLNDAAGDREGRAAFLDFQPMGPPADLSRDDRVAREFVRKSAIDLVAVSDAEAGQATAGAAGDVAPRYREKTPARITLELGAYTLIGDMYRAPGETVEDVLNAGAQFLPLTGVTMVRDNLFYGTRPFVAVNKREVISCREESPGGSGS
jgi:hypothetical protein